MSRLRWPDSTNSVPEKPGTVQAASEEVPGPPAGFRGAGPNAPGKACASANVRPSPNMPER